MRVARAARGRSRALIALKLLLKAACCIFMGVWGAYIRPPNRMHTSPFILITLIAPHNFSNAPRALKALIRAKVYGLLVLHVNVLRLACLELVSLSFCF